MNDCLFCKIVAKEIPADIVYEDEDIIAFKDINPQAPVHILIIPKIHINSHNDIKDFEIVAKISAAINQIAKEQKVDQSGYRIINNCGNDGGQEVQHIHWHLLGSRQMNWPPG